VQNILTGDKMICEAVYCIYNRNCICLLGKTTINALGMCEECIIVSLDRNFLETEKERQFLKMEQQERSGDD